MPTIWGDKVTAGDVAFNDRPSLPVGVIHFNIDDLPGWDNTADIDFNTVAIGGAVDGEIVASETPAKARHLLVAGYVNCETRAIAETMRDVLWRDAFPRGIDIQLTRYEGIPKFITARVSSDRDILPVSPESFRFIVPLVAGDPFKYGTAVLSDTSGAAGQSTGGRTYPRNYPLSYGTILAGEGNALSLTNAGAIASSNLVLTITGPLNSGSWRVSNETTGEDISFSVDVASTDVLVIDFRQGLALLNGYPIGSSIIGDFWKLEPGVNVIKLFADYDPAVSISAIGFSAWE